MSENRPVLKLPMAVAYIAALLLWPVVGVTRPLAADFLNTPEVTVYILVFFTTCLACWKDVAQLFVFNRDNIKNRLHVLCWSAYLSLFLTSCLLCRRLKICVIHIHNISLTTGSWIGPPLVILGAFFVLRSLFPRAAATGGSPTLIAYPKYLGLILILAGVSLAHWAWFPLLALPGVLVVEAWYIGRQAACDQEKNVVNRPSGRFKIVPFIY